MIELFDLEHSIGDLVLADPDDHGDAVIESIVDLFLRLRVVIVEGLSGDSSSLELTHDLESISSHLFAHGGNEHLCGF